MKNILKKYKNIIILISITSILVIYPLLLTIFNPIPPKKNLIPLLGKIIEIGKDAPFMKIKDTNNIIKIVYFPSSLFFIAAGDSKFPQIKPETRKKLLGCTSLIYIEKIKFLYPQRLRVWEINCDQINIDYNQFSSWYNAEINATKWLELLILIIGSILFFKSFKSNKQGI